MLVKLLEGSPPPKTPRKFWSYFYFEKELFAYLPGKIYKLTCNFSKAQALISYKQGIENIPSHK